MKLHLYELKEPRSLSIDEKDQWFVDIFKRLKVKHEGLLSLQLNISKEKEIVIVQGHFIAKIILTCSRCAEEAPLEIDEFFAPVFMHGKDPETGDVALHASELDVTFFEGDQLDVSEVVQEQVELMLPYQPLCKEQCQGICQGCGRNLNEGKCGCKEDVHLSPFSVLKDLNLSKSIRG